MKSNKTKTKASSPQERPFYLDYGYTGEDWRNRQHFEHIADHARELNVQYEDDWDNIFNGGN